MLADCLRSNDYLLPYYKSTIDRFVTEGGDRAIPVAILGVKREYLEASFEEMQRQYRTIESYFDNGLGIDAAGQAELRALLLENNQ